MAPLKTGVPTPDEASEATAPAAATPEAAAPDATTGRARVPDALAARLEGYAFSPTDLGASGAATQRLSATGRPTLYLKVMSREEGGLDGERVRLEWAARRVPSPTVLAFVTEGAHDYLLLAEVPGVPLALATELPIAARVTTFAEGLRRLHDLPVAECPFDGRLAARMAEATRRVEAGLVDESDFDEERQGRSAASVLGELRARLHASPIAESPVVTHGDYTLPNVLVAPDGRLSGYVDFTRLGVADRYQDLALAVRDVGGTFGPQWVAPLVQAYGLPALDTVKVELFRLLDELF
jgi:aminoglycoside 3'-phosphotransferase-2